MKLLLTAEEAAQELRVSRAKAYELLAEGRLPSVRIDGCRRIRRRDLEQFVEGLSPSGDLWDRPVSARS